MMHRHLLKLVMIVSFAICMVACGKDKTPENGEIMIVNASPGLSSVSVTIDGTSFGSGTLNYPSNTGYRTLAEGSHVLQATATGSSTPLFEGSLSTIANARQSLYLYDRSTTLKAFAVVDNISVPPTGKARLRFFNLSPNSPVLDAGVEGGSSFTAIFASRAFEDNVSAIENSVFQNVDAGTYKFQLRVNGAGVVLIESASLVLEAGKSYTLFAKGISGSIETPLGLELIANN